MSISFTWLGHSTFLFDLNGRQVITDPFLTDNPLGAMSADEVTPEVILVSHAHYDHVADVPGIAQRTGATVICNFEMGNYYLDNGLEEVVQVNPGGTFDAGFFSVRWTIAHHSSSFPDGTYGGQPNGYVIMHAGKKLYFAGDTDLFLEMQLIGDMGIDAAFLPIGDHFTMGLEDSLRAIEFIRPQVVVPMHYNTFPPIMQDVAEWANRVNSLTDAIPIVLDPGGSHTLT
jgi:L-ascorbate metabolism protein UlaG (beta-lactamase superfamily)